MTGERLEVVVLIEGPRVVVDCVDQNRSSASATGGGDDGVERMDEQLGTEATRLDRGVERELG